MFLLKYQHYLCNNFDILHRNLFFPFLMGFKDIAIDPDLNLRLDFAVCFQIDCITITASHFFQIFNNQ